MGNMSYWMDKIEIKAFPTYNCSLLNPIQSTVSSDINGFS